MEWFPPELELLKFPSGNRSFIWVIIALDERNIKLQLLAGFYSVTDKGIFNSVLRASL